MTLSRSSGGPRAQSGGLSVSRSRSAPAGAISVLTILALLLPTLTPFRALAQSADGASADSAHRPEPAERERLLSERVKPSGASPGANSGGTIQGRTATERIDSAKAKGTPAQAAARLPADFTGQPTDQAADDASAPETEPTAAESPEKAPEAAVVAPGDAASKTGASSQAISVPKGAGTLEGMGESFSTQLSTGVATFTVPFALPAARGGAQPSLALSYSSASGWGIAGMGWDLGVPYIARQTDRGTPRYNDQSDFFADQDRFVFNGGQELVPICTVGGTGGALTCSGALASEAMPPWSAGSQYFRSRVEGSFMRFFWSADHLTWRVQDKSGVTLELGVPLDGKADRGALEVNPDDSSQIFRWNLVRQYDTQGTANPTSATGFPAPNNVVVYRYITSGNATYLSDIYDTTPSAAPTTSDLSRFAHHAHLAYEQRTDPTVSFRTGWRVERTQRLIRVDVTSKSYNNSDVQARRLLRRYRLSYNPTQHASLLESVQTEGRCGPNETSSTDAPSENVLGLLPDTGCPRLPAMTFEYTHVAPYSSGGGTAGIDLTGYEGFDERIRNITAAPDHSVDEALTDLFDLNGDALPDVMVTAPGLYGNAFGKFINSPGGISDSFSAASSLPVAGVLGATAADVTLQNPNLAALDVDGDGRVDLVHAPAAKTYSIYSLGADGWVGRAVTTASQQNLKVDFGRDALTTRVFDVNADGLVDVVVTTGTEIQTFLSLGRYPQGKDQLGAATRSGPTSSNISNDPIRACLPWSGSVVDFGDREIQLGDMNGDGLQDIIRVQPGSVLYWPGRGNGTWGTGSPGSCVPGTPAANVEVRMTSSPEFTDSSGSSLRVDDVNGDGLDDLVQVRSDAVDVWLNVDGVSWTPRHMIQGTPPAPDFTNRVRVVDINGSGTRDLLWADAGGYKYIDLQGGQRPGLLSRVRNGLGKSTDITYSTSTAEMLAAEQSGTTCTGAPWSSPWCSKMPIVTQVVKRVTESDNLTIGGFGPNQLVTEYSYRDAVYDGRQREFRGFRRTRAKQIGDANSPTSYSESLFLLGDCTDQTSDASGDCADLSRDNPREALKGLPIVSERYSESGVYLSTDIKGYRLRKLYTGRDGREVRHAFESSHRQVSYDTALGAPTTGSTLTYGVVETETSLDSSFDPVSNPLAYPVGLNTETWSIPVRSTSATATIDSRNQVDYFGNQVVGIALGCVAGSACPAAGTTGIDDNETLYSFTIPTRPSGDETGWLFRTGTAYVKGSLSNHTAARKKTTTTYNSKGLPTQVQADLSGTVALDRRHRTLTGASAVAPAPSGRSVDGVITVASYEYDKFGNRTIERGPNGRCHEMRYEVGLFDSKNNNIGYAQLVTSEFTYTTGCGAASLATAAAYDRGLAKPTLVLDVALQPTFVTYDGFGRLTAVTRPSPTGVVPSQPSLSVIYTLADSTHAYSTIESRSQDGANANTASYLWSVSFVDGMGRTRLTRSEADASATGRDDLSAVQGGLVVYDSKGAVARTYLPQFATAVATDAPPTAVSGSFARAQYDAFGRTSDTFDLAPDATSGVHTLHTDYHALSADNWDAADLGLDTAGRHQGTYATTRQDGHGRVVAVTERIFENNSLDAREIRTKYLPSGEPEAITRVHPSVPSDTPLLRWMRYDTLGRMVLNVEPHTSVNFSSDLNASATVSPSGLRAWRYAYNDAGDLVGTSDARGCGVNYTYDGAGRVLSEDYSPCEAAHAPYSTPNFNTFEGIEVYYLYDSMPETFYSVFPWPIYPLYAKGRLTAVVDRAGVQFMTYDARGRTVQVARRIANPDPTVVSPTARYRGRAYITTTSYDAADRVVRQSTGAISPEFQDVASNSDIQIDYSARGTLSRVYGSFGDLISSVKRSADGQIEQVTYGDAAATTLAQTYTSRRWLESSRVSRSSPSIWTAPPGNYTPVPTPGTPSAFQTVPRDELFDYDIVGNPITITDRRTASEWPAGAKPVSRSVAYDDLYRVSQVDYSYAGGSDTFTSPYAYEQSGLSDPRQSGNFARQLVLAQRIKKQTFKYDWLGSLTQADDDLNAMWDRGVGPIGNYASTGMPYRWKNAGDSALSTWPGNGAADALAYDETGNLLDFQVTRTGACTGGGTNCDLRFTYAYDELGRLNNAQRREGTTLKADLSFTYDSSDDRVIKSDNTLAQKLHTAYIFDSLELRRTTFDNTSGDYAANSQTETVFLNANGVRVGRVTYEGSADGEPRIASVRRHVLLEIGDHLGSTSVVIDKATGELAERLTFQAYGATESDYRPDRWKGFREDYRFTGKEEDIEVGLTYFGKRFLSAPLGRWVSPDPLAVHAAGQADLNLYAYVHGAVLAATDPLGLAEPESQPVEIADWGYAERMGAQNTAVNNAPSTATGLDSSLGKAPAAPVAQAAPSQPPSRAQSKPATTEKELSRQLDELKHQVLDEIAKAAGESQQEAAQQAAQPDCGGGSNMCQEGTPPISSAQGTRGGSGGSGKSTQVDIVSGAGDSGSPERILFGQRRVAPTFRQFSEASDAIRGRSLVDVASDLRAGRISPNELPIDYYTHNGRQIAVNNRGLAALRLAGMEPTITREVPVTRNLLERLGPPVDSMHRMPGTRLPVTLNKDGSGHLYTVHSP